MAVPTINMFLQYAGREYNADDIVAKVKEAAAADTGKKTFKSLDIYVKPEENVAYYVVNGKPGSQLPYGRQLLIRQNRLRDHQAPEALLDLFVDRSGITVIQLNQNNPS